MRIVDKQLTVRPVTRFAILTVAFAAMLFIAQADPAAAQTATANRPAGTAVATTAATVAGGAGTVVATRAATTAATAARPAATGAGGGVAATPVRPAPTTVRPAATRPANAGAAPAVMPRAGGGGMATSFTDEGAGPTRGLWFGFAGLAAVAAGGLLYARRMRNA